MQCSTSVRVFLQHNSTIGVSCLHVCKRLGVDVRWVDGDVTLQYRRRYFLVNARWYNLQYLRPRKKATVGMVKIKLS